MVGCTQGHGGEGARLAAGLWGVEGPLERGGESIEDVGAHCK